MSIKKDDPEMEALLISMRDTVDDMFMRMFGRSVCDAELSDEELAELEGDDDEDEVDEE
jgi:Arc/MetJ family transcription regulator